MDKELNYYYKTCDFIFQNLKESFQKEQNEYGYNFDTNKRRNFSFDYSKEINKISKDFLNNNKIR